MSDRDPRPMPTDVQRAYRDPVDLRRLLMSSVYSEQDRRDVLQSLTRSLIARYGDVWIVAGSKEVRVSTRVKQIKKNVVNAIDLLTGIDEYDGDDGVLPLLAKAMQPRWAEWWGSFVWNDWDSVSAWRDVSMHVLGQRQLVWLAAQHARVVVDRTQPYDRSVALNAIEAAEAWARVPSEENRRAARVAAAAASAASAATIVVASANAYVAAASAAYAAYANAANAAYDAAAAAAYAADAAAASDAYVAAYAASNAAAAAAYARFAALTKSLITPTLVTSASGAVHSTRRR